MCILVCDEKPLRIAHGVKCSTLIAVLNQGGIFTAQKRGDIMSIAIESPSLLIEYLLLDIVSRRSLSRNCTCV